MPKTMPLLQWSPLERSLQLRRPQLANRALLDFKAEEAWQGQQAQMVRIRVRSRLFPWRVDEWVAPFAQEGDAELLDLTGVPGQYQSNRSPRLTRSIRNEESKATTYATLAHASGKAQQKRSPLHPLIVGAEIVVIGVLAMLGWIFAQEQQFFSGGPTF